jgi:hypothetical protein
MSNLGACPRCKTELKEGARFCGNCGAECQTAPDHPRASKPAPSRTVAPRRRAVAPVMLVIGLVLLWKGWSLERESADERGTMSQTVGRARERALDLMDTAPEAGEWLQNSVDDIGDQWSESLRRQRMVGLVLEICGCVLVIVALTIWRAGRRQVGPADPAG